MNVTPATFFNRRWWWVTLIVIGGMLFLIRLGFWQLDRLAWRQNLNAEKLVQLEADPLDLNSDLSALNLAEMRNRKATAVGQYDYANELIAISQVYQNQSGNYLLTPLMLDDNTAVIVNRGWLPNSATSDLSQFHQPTAPTEITGYLQLSEELSSGERSTITNGELFRIDLAAINNHLPYTILPVYLQEAPPAVNDGQLPYRLEPDLSLDEGDHFSYALQWFSFSILLAIIYIAYVNQRYKKDT